MINSTDVLKKIKECLIDGEEILLFSSQLKPWRFIDKFWVIFFLICMIFNLLCGIFKIIINPTMYGIGTSFIYFVVFILLLFIYIFCKPFKKMSVKYPESYYAFTNYRIIYVKPNMFFGNKMYYYDFISDVSMNIYPTKSSTLGYKYVVSFMYDANDNYERGVTSSYKIYLKTKEEVDKISKIISEHPTKEEKERYYQILKSPRSIKIMTIRHLLESIITGVVFYFMYENGKSPILYSFFIFIGFFTLSMFTEWLVIHTSEKENNKK